MAEKIEPSKHIGSEIVLFSPAEAETNSEISEMKQEFERLEREERVSMNLTSIEYRKLKRGNPGGIGVADEFIKRKLVEIVSKTKTLFRGIHLVSKEAVCDSIDSLNRDGGLIPSKGDYVNLSVGKEKPFSFAAGAESGGAKWGLLYKIDANKVSYEPSAYGSLNMSIEGEMHTSFVPIGAIVEITIFRRKDRLAYGVPVASYEGCVPSRAEVEADMDNLGNSQ